jgi:hypothetical protein
MSTAAGPLRSSHRAPLILTHPQAIRPANKTTAPRGPGAAQRVKTVKTRSGSGKESWYTSKSPRPGAGEGCQGLRFVVVTSAFSLVLLAASAAVAESPEDQALPIVDKYLDATQTQQNLLRGAQMEIDIDAALPRLEKRGKLRALRMISRLGKITYKALGFYGDNTVKQEVIARYLAAESEGRENGTIAIAPANYKFRYTGRIVQNGQTTVILQVTPRKKAIGLFKGELWIDADTGMPLRESGEFVKSPSVFLKKIAFVRDYELRDGVSIPKHIASRVDTRVVGRAELQIEFSNFTKQENAEDDSVTVANGQ